MSSIQSVKQDMQRVIDVLTDDLRTLRPGRASAELVTTLPVDVYGQKMPIQQLAAVSSNEQGQLVVAPWDKSTTGAIEATIRQSQLGFSLVNEGAQLRLSLPPLSQERRQELVKIVGQKGEAARIALRQIRTESNQQATKDKAAGIIREDELNRHTKELNSAIDDFNAKVKSLTETKEKELLTV